MGQPCESEGEEYLKTVAAVEACYESAANGQVVRIDRNRTGQATERRP
jgi:hypothetical protein